MKTKRMILLTRKPALISLLLFIAGGSLFGRVQPVSLDRTLSPLVEVEIKGQVQNPGVYTLKRSDTLQNLIKQAGGSLEDADLSALSLVEAVQDRKVVVIPKKNEEQALISINTASEEELQKLRGIGPAMAKRIVDYRSENPFETVEDLMKVRGIGEKTLEKIRDRICL